MPIGLHHMRYFVAVAEERHISRAAARLFISQPSLSAQIRYLEEQLGVTLLQRHARGVELTPAGEAFLREARATLAAASAAIEGARRAARGESGHLKVGMIVGTQIEVTSKILAEFRQKHPGVTLDMVEHSFADPSAGLNKREVDAAFVMPPIEHNGLSFEQFYEAGRVAVLPSSHPLATRASISVTELFDEPWIVAETDDRVCRDFWLAMEKRKGVPPKIGHATRSIDKFVQLTAAGEVVGLAAEWVVEIFARPGITFVDVDDVAPATTALAWWPDATTPLVEDLIDITRAVRGSNAPSGGDAPRQ